MTRSILAGLLGLFSIGAIGVLPLACQSGGIGDPCVPEDEYESNFAGFKVTEENIESRSFQCATRICLVNHFQGRVTCPLGQPGIAEPGSTRAFCTPTNPKDPKDHGDCADPAEFCREAATRADDCANDSTCPSGTTCDKTRKVCTCTADIGSYKCALSNPADPKSVRVLKTFVCHKPSNCQTADGTKAENSTSKGDAKDCCVPGTDTPVSSAVCGQCAAKSNRTANNAVYCSCRCGPADVVAGSPAASADGSDTFNYCTCPSGFTCGEIRPNVGISDPQLTGKYCIKEASAYTNTPAECGTVVGHRDETCAGLVGN